MFYVQETHLMAQIAGVHIQTRRNPILYSVTQIEHACAIAKWLNRGIFALMIEPEEPDDDLKAG